MRGQQKLFNDFIEPHQPLLVAVKGRSATLIDARNELLLHRYYWHSRREIEPGIRMSFDSLLSAVSDEFFIERRTIINVLDACYRDYQLLRTQYKDHTDAQLSRHLKARWPWLVW